MATQIDELTVKLTADVASFQAAMGGAVGSVTKQLSKIGVAAAGVGAAFAAVGVAANVLADATSKAADFEQSITNAASKTDNFAAAQTAFKDAAIKAGLATAFSAQQTADALNILATAGFGIAEATDALPGVLQLAQAGMLSLSDAADITATAMRGYGFAASELGRVNDVLVSAFTGANQTASELGQALRKAGPLAKTLGQDFETTVTVLSALADAGFKAEEGGTALKVAFARLAEPTKKVADRLNELGVRTRASGGKLRDMIDILADLGKANANAGDLAVIFGQRAGPTLASLLVQGEDKLRDFNKRLEESGGKAAELEGRQLATLGSQFKILTGTIETIAIAFGSVLGPAIKPIITAFQRQAQSSLESGNALRQFQGIVVSATGVMITMLDIFAASAPAILSVATSLRIGANLFQILQGMIVGVGRVIVGFTTIAVGGLIRGVGDLIQILAEGANAVGSDFGPKLNAAGQAISGFAGDVTKLGAEWADLESTQKGVAGDMLDIENAIAGLKTTTNDTADRLGKLRFALKEGQEAVKKISNGAFLGSIALQKFGDSADGAKKKFRDFKTEVEETAFDKLLKGKGPSLGPLLKTLRNEFGKFEIEDDKFKAFDERIALELEAGLKEDLVRQGALRTMALDGLKDFGKGLADTLGASDLFSGFESILSGAAAGGPFGALIGGAQAIGGMLLKGAGSLIDMAKETQAFQFATRRVADGMKALGIPPLDRIMEDFMSSITPVVEIFTTVAEALGPLNVFGGDFFDTIGEGVFNAVKAFVLFVLEFNKFIQDSIAMIAGISAQIIGAIASALEFFEREVFDLDISDPVRDLAKSLFATARDAEDTSKQLGAAANQLEALSFGAAKARQQQARLADQVAVVAGVTIGFFSDAVGDATKTIQDMNEQLTNVPQGIKLALRRFQATEGVEPMAMAAPAQTPSAGFTGGGGFETFLGAQGAGPVQITINGDLVIQAATDEQAGTILDKIRAVSNFQRIAESGKLPTGVSPYLAREIGA